MNSRATIAFVFLALMPLAASGEEDLCRSYITKFPALNATFTVHEGMKLKNTAWYNARKNGSAEVFTLRKDAVKASAKDQMYPWPMRTAPQPSIKRLEVNRSPSGQIKDINDGSVHLTLQYDSNGHCVPDAIFDSPLTGQPSLMANTQVCGTLSNYLKNNPQYKPCVQGKPSVIDATLARHEGDIQAFTNANPQLNACIGDGPSSGVPLLRLLENNASPFATIDGVSDGPKAKTLTQSLEGAHALWESCKRYALVEHIGEIKTPTYAPGGGGTRGSSGSGPGKK